jgi:hypothetical protein
MGGVGIFFAALAPEGLGVEPSGFGLGRSLGFSDDRSLFSFLERPCPGLGVLCFAGLFA